MNIQKKRSSINVVIFSLFLFFQFISHVVFAYKPYLEISGGRYFNQNSNIVDQYDLFIPLLNRENKLFFTDIRLFGRSGGSYESNIHFGLRKLYPNEEEMIGVYAAFDFRRSDNENWFNQVMIGGEYWASKWFLGGNIYMPLGETKKNISKTAKVDKLDSKAIYIAKYYEEALSGADAEVGYSLTDSLTSYVGIYYFHVKEASDVVGPRIRFVYSHKNPDGRILGVLDGVGVEVGLQHDKPRGTTAHVGISLRIGITDLEDNSNVFGFKQHMVDLVRRDPDIVIR